MKSMIRISIVFGLLLATACQSEYERQLVKAKEIVRKEICLRNEIEAQGNFSPVSKQSLFSLKEEINFRAHMSGNQDVFLEEIHGYKSRLSKDTNYDQLMISKYP